MKQRGLSILLALVFLLSVFMFCTTAFAAENSADGLNAVLTTDKKDYVNGETIGVKLDVTNTSIYVNNVRTELIIPEGVDLVEGQLKSDAAAVTAGQTLSYSYVLSVPKVEVPTTQAPTTQAPTTQAPTTVAPTTGEGDDGPADTGDTSAVIFGILAVASLAGLIALTFGAKLLKQRWFVLIVCAGLLLGMVAPVAANAAISEKSFELTEAITIDGAAAEVKAIITYDLDDGEILASEVEFKKDGKSLYALVPEKGWYTPSNASITVDGVAATNNTRPEVTASYIDMLFGCTSTKTGNFVKGEFDNAKIVSDDAELQLLVGLTKDVASRKALAHINYNEWIIAEIDGKVVVTGWFDNATAAATRYLYNLVKDQDNVTLSLPITGKVEGFVTDIPQPSVGTFNGGLDGAEGIMVLSYKDMTAEKFLTYAKELEAAGYTLYSENEILNYGTDYNLFRTYTKGESAVHIAYTPDTFVNADPATLTPNEKAYLSRSFRPSGCEMRIITDSTKHLFTNDANNKYEDAGITPKVNIVNLFNQVADGNNNAECMIFTLADGSFIVADGGFAQDADHVYKALQQLNEREDGKIVVAAWIMSHHHGDHVGAIKAMAEKDYAKNIIIEQFIFNPTAPTYYWRLMNAPYNYGGDFNYSTYNHSVFATMLEKFGGDTQIVNPHMGQRMQIRNADVEFLYTGDEDLFHTHMDNTNDSSMVYTVNFDMGTETAEDDSKILMLNDSCVDSQYGVIMPLYSQVMDCDIVQVGHHGLGGPSSSLYRMMEPKVGIWCSTKSTADKNHWLTPDEKGKLGGSAKYLIERPADDDNVPVPVILLAEHYVQTLELPYAVGDVIDKRILTDYYTGLYDVEEVDVAYLPAFRFQGKFNAKYEDILAELESYDADVMILSQIDQLCTAYNNADVIGKLMADLDFTYYAYAPVWNANKDFSGNMETGEGTMGHLILSRYPITSAQTVVLVEGNTTKWATPEGRGFCHAVLDVDGLTLDVYATHLSNDSINGFNAALAGDHKPTGDYWMIVGNCNQATYEDGIKKVAPVAANLNGGNFEVYGDANIEFTNAKIHDNWKAMINQNMGQTYTFTARLSRYLVSDNVRTPTPETDMMLWCTNTYGGSQGTLTTIMGELKYVHPEIAVIVMADNSAVNITPAELAEQTGYKYYSYVEAYTYHATRTDFSRGSIILSDFPMEEKEKVVLTPDGTTTEGRAFGHVVMTIDGVEVDVWYGFNNSNPAQVTQLAPYIQAVAEETGRQFIVSGYRFEGLGSTYAGAKIKKAYQDPGYVTALSEGELQIASTNIYPKSNLGITSARVGDQIWVTFGEPSMTDLPNENRFMQWWLGRIENQNQVDLIAQEIREQNPAICALINLSNLQYADFDPVDIAESLGYPYYDYAKYSDADGVHKGYLVLSKYPLEFQESKTTARNTAVFWYTTEIDGRPLDIYVGHDFALASYEDWIKTNADADNSDFVVFGHYLNSYPTTFAGRNVAYANSGTNYLLMSTSNTTVTNPITHDKPEGLTHAANGNPLTLEFEVKQLGTTVMAWWLNGWRNQTEVDAMISQIKEADVDIAVVVSAGNFRMADMTVEKFVEQTGYKYWYFEYVADPMGNGTQRGNLMLSKTPINYVDHTLYNNLKFSHLTTSINYRQIDLFMGYDIAPSAVEAYVKEKVDASGNDFIIFGHNFSGVSNTYAGKAVVKQAVGTTALVVSQDNQTVVGSKIVAKDPEALSWAGHGDQAHMEIDVTPKPVTNVMAWWLNGWQNADHVGAMVDEIKKQDLDITVVVSAGNFRYADITVEEFVEMTGYKYWYYEDVADPMNNGTTRGNLMLSKTELKYDGYIDVDGLKFSHLTTVINENELDLFMGYDISPESVEGYVKDIADKSGNDFLVFAFFNKGSVGETFAGRDVTVARNADGVNLIATGKDQTVLETKIVPKPEVLAWAGYLDEVHMTLDVGTPTPEKPETELAPKELNVLGWWVGGMDNATKVATIAEQIKELNPDIAMLLNVNETTDGAVDADKFAASLGYEYYHYCLISETDGIGKGYLVLSKYPVEFQASKTTARNTTINYLIANVEGREIDLYIGHDFAIDTYTSWIESNSANSGNDFIICGHYINTYSDTVAGKAVEYTNSGTIYLMASTDETKVLAKETKDKPANLTDARINKILTMQLEISVPVVRTPVDVDVMGWWIAGMGDATEVATITEQIKTLDPDIAILLNVEETTDGVVDADKLVKELGYEYYHYCLNSETDGVGKGYLVMSKYPVEFKASKTTARNTTINYLTVDINGKSVDLYAGHDFAIDTYASWIASNSANSGNDFIICGHYINTYSDTVAGKAVEYTNSGTIYLMASTDETKVLAKETKDKPANLTDARINKILVMNLSI